MEETTCLLCGAQGAELHLESEAHFAPLTGERFRFERCPRCALVFLNPRPTEGEIGRYYPEDYLPHRGAEAWGRWAPLVRASQRRLDGARVALVRRYAKIGPQTRVLDVGCGRATFLRTLHRRTAARCVGVDASAAGWGGEPHLESGVRLIEGTLSAVGPALSAGSGEQRPLEGSDAWGFDVVTLWHALEHDHRPRESLRLLRRLASRRGLLVVEVPDLDSWSARIQGPWWGGLHTPRHMTAFTRTTLCTMLEAAGWRVERHFAYGTLDPWVIWWLGRRARRGDSLTGPLERRFPGFVAGKVLGWPLWQAQRRLPLGVQLALARPDS